MFDVHCHIIHGVDDGSGSLEESKQMLLAAKKNGITGMVCTPHCRGRHFDMNKIRLRYQELAPYAHKLGLQFDLGYEVYWEKLLELGVEMAPRLQLGNSGLFLLEFGYASFPPNLERLIYELQGMGLQVIIAHPERYAPVQQDIEEAFRLKEMGCFLQLSGNYASSGRFSASYKAAVSMLKAGLVDYVASDAHCVDDYADFAKALKKARKF